MYSERAIDPISLSKEQVQKICESCFGKKGELKAFALLSGGAVNTTYQLLWGDEKLFLKLYVRDHTLADIESHVYALVKNQVAVPELLHVDLTYDPHPYALFRFFEGKPIHELGKEVAKELSFELGKALSQIHGFQFEKAGLFGRGLEIAVPFEEGSSPYFAYCKEQLVPESLSWKRLGERRAKRLQEVIMEREKDFPMIGQGGVLVHSDFKPVNLLWSEREGLCTLDWEFAHVGDGLMDFAILLRHEEAFPCALSELERGYGKTFFNDWREKVRLLDMINVIQLLNMPGERPELFKKLYYQICFFEK